MSGSEVWGKVYGDLWCHPKFITLAPGPGWLWTKALSYSKAMGTYGVIGRQLLPLFSASPEDAQGLVDAGLWEEVREGWRFHDWDEYQTTRERDARVSQVRSEAGKKGGRPRKSSSTEKPVTSGDKHPESNLPSNVEATRKQAESNGKAELELERELEPSPSSPPDVQGELLQSPPPAAAPRRGAVYPDAFEAWWKVWPKPGDTKRTAFTAWEKATKGNTRQRARVTPEHLQAAVEAFASDPNLPDPQYMPAAATWLNQDRWENGPLPARRGPAPRDGFAQSLSVVQQLAAQQQETYPPIHQSIPESRRLA